MFGKIAGFELRYQLRQPAFYLALILFFLLSFGSIASENIGLGAGGNVNRNAPFVIANATIFFVLIYMLVVTAFVANVVIRDDQTGYGPIVRSAPVRKFDLLIGRFTGAYIVVALSFLAIPLGFIVGTLMPWVDRETVGPFRPGDYLHSYLVWGLPGLLLISAFLFGLATATRSMMATYVGVIALMVGYSVALNLLGDLDIDEEIVGIIEPFGAGAFGVATQYWTTAERNTLNVPFEGVVLYNRLLVLGLSAAILAVTYHLFRFETRGRKDRRSEKLAKAEAAAVAPAPAGRLADPAFGAGFSWAVLSKRASFEAGQVIKSPAYAVLLLIGVLFAGSLLWFSPAEIFGAPVLPVTRIVITGLQGGFGLILMIIAIYYSGEVVWRERDRRIHEIVDSSAVPDWAFVVPKTLAVILVLGSVLLVAMLTGIAVQTARGFYNYELGKYFAWFFLPSLYNFGLTAVLAVFVQALSPNKFVGWAVMVVYLISTLVLGNIGFDHKLYQYGSSLSGQLSDINGRGDFGRFTLWFDLYWGAFATILVVLAYAMWRRGTESRYRPRLRRLPQRLRGAPGLIAGAALVAFAGLGSWIFINTNVWNEYESGPAQERRTAAYEKALIGYENVPQPIVTDVKLELDLEPRASRLRTRGSYVIANSTDAPLRQVHLRLGDDQLKIRRMAVEGARLTREYPRFDYRIYTFDRPMAPGERRRVEFETVLEQKGFRNSGNLTRIADNGTFINNSEFSPQIGMTRDGLLQDRAKRRKHGLPPARRMAKLEDPAARRYPNVRADWVRSDITVTTVAGQTPVAPGYKVSDVTRNGRRTARFVSEAPILHFFSVQSADYKIKSELYKGIELTIFYDEDHPYNVDRIMTALKSSLDYYQANFGPYQFRQARIVEFPYGSFAQSFANTIAFSENVGFIADLADPGEIDYVTNITAHEIAHQWWAHQIIGADKQGATVLSETLAEYSALMVMEKMYGPDQIRRFLKYGLDTYLTGRTTELVEETPLIRVEGQPYIRYQKGGSVMYLLRDKIGEAAVNRAMRRVLETYKFKGAPYPDATELLIALRQEAGPEHQALITDLFERVTLYDLKAEEAVTRRRPDGRWETKLTVEAKKLYADGEGDETEAPLNEMIDVGLFTAEVGEGEFDRGDVVLFERRPVRTGTQTFTFVTARKPTQAGVDPYNKWIDRNSGDNLKKVG